MIHYTTDEFLGGRVLLKQPENGYRATSDAVLLAAAVQAKPNETILDVGTGTGVIPLCLHARLPNVIYTGIECQSELAALARENAAFNRCDLTVVEADITHKPSPIHGRQFHHVVTNPPFYTESGTRNHPQTATAYKQQVPLSVWLGFCLRHLRAKGTLTLIHRTESLPEILTCLHGRLGGLEVFPIEPKPGKSAKRIIVRGVMGSKKPLTLHAGLIMHRPDDTRTEIAECLMRQGQGIDELLKTS